MLIDQIILVACYLIFQMLVVWIISMHYQNPSIVDLSWPIGLVISGLIYLCAQQYTYLTMMVSILLLAWGTRLAFYLWYTRIRLGKKDKRYQKLSDDWQFKSLGFLFNFQLQGFLIFVISSVFLFIGMRTITEITWLDLIAAGLIVISIVLETVSDQQLERCKKLEQKKVCDDGLWHFSRHPNYFFDWLTWCGFTLFAIQEPYGFIGVIAPLTLYLIFTRITGPMTEQGSLESRGKAYARYQKKTNMFFPGPTHSINDGKKVQKR